MANWKSQSRGRGTFVRNLNRLDFVRLKHGYYHLFKTETDAQFKYY